MQVGHRLADEISLRGAGTDDWCAASGADEMSQEAEAGLARVLHVPSRGVGDDDDVGADRRIDRFGGGELRAEVVDRGRLLDVEGLAPCHLSGRVDQPHFGHAVAHGQCVRHGTAKRAAADDRDETHPTRLF